MGSSGREKKTQLFALVAGKKNGRESRDYRIGAMAKRLYLELTKDGVTISQISVFIKGNDNLFCLFPKCRFLFYVHKEASLYFPN